MIAIKFINEKKKQARIGFYVGLTSCVGSLNNILALIVAYDMCFLKFKITDDYTGIKSYRGEINGKWILLEYEPKNNTLIFDFDELKFETALHELILEAEDFVRNKTIFSIDFYRK